MNDPLYPSVSKAEFDRRHQRLWEEMDARSLDAVIVYGDSSGVFANFANCFYLTGYRDRLFSYALVFPGRQPVLLISNALYLPTAHAMARVESVDALGWDPGARLADELRAAGVTNGRVGLAGTAGIQKSTMPYEHREKLSAALPHVEWDDVTEVLQTLRRVKSSEEIELLRRGAEMTDATLVALERDGRVGMSDAELAGIIAAEGFRLGGEPRTLFVGSTSMDEPEIVFPRQTPSLRRIRTGDVFLTELSTDCGGYSGQVHRPLLVGDVEPTAEYQAVFDVARETCERVLAAMGPGQTDEDLRQAAGPVIKDAGMWTMDTLLHGWGLSLEPPRIDARDVAVIDRPQPPITFEPGMTMVLQPHILSPDKRRGLQLGSLVVITEDGAEALQKHPMEWGRIDG